MKNFEWKNEKKNGDICILTQFTCFQDFTTSSYIMTKKWYYTCGLFWNGFTIYLDSECPCLFQRTSGIACRMNFRQKRDIYVKTTLILKKTALVMGICTIFTCFQTLRPLKGGFLYWNRIFSSTSRSLWQSKSRPSTLGNPSIHSVVFVCAETSVSYYLVSLLWNETKRNETKRNET